MLPEFNSLCVCCAHLFLFLYSAALLASLHYAQMMKNHYRGLVMVIGVLIRLGYLSARASTILFQLGF